MDQIEVNIAPRNINTTKVNKKDKIKLKKQELKLKQERKQIKRQKYNVQKNEVQDPQQEYQQNQDYQTEAQEQKYKPKKQITAELAKERIINKKIDIPEIQSKQHETDELFANKYFKDIDYLSDSIKRALSEANFQQLTYIQNAAIPLIFQKKNTVIKSETGSGKTLAYLVPLIQLLQNTTPKVERSQGTFILILCPTRELSLQVVDMVLKAGKRCPNIVTGALVGGENANHEKSRLRKGVTILVGTPGRILYHMENSSSFVFDKINTVIFEECDRILDMGFKKDVDLIIKLLEKQQPLENIQKILVSAHINQNISTIYGLNLSPKEYEFIGFTDDYKLKSQRQYLLGQKAIQQPENMEWLGDGEDKWEIPKTLQQYYTLIQENHKLSFLLSYFLAYKGNKIIIFVSTCDEVELISYLCENLKVNDDKLIQTPAYKLHGNIDQKTRSKTYFEFKKQTAAILISTSVASRGLDFPDVTNILLFDPPDSYDDYINKVGRTARINKNGMSLLVLFDNQESYDFIKEIQQHLNSEIHSVDPYDYFHKAQQHLASELNITDFADKFLGYQIKLAVNEEREIYFMSRRAYVSFIRAYGRLKQFKIKTLNLHKLSKSFGLEKAVSTETKDQRYQKELMKVNREKFRQQGIYLNGEKWEELRKKRKVATERELNKMEFL